MEEASEGRKATVEGREERTAGFSACGENACYCCDGGGVCSLNVRAIVSCGGSTVAVIDGPGWPFVKGVAAVEGNSAAEVKGRMEEGTDGPECAGMEASDAGSAIAPFEL